MTPAERETAEQKAAERAKKKADAEAQKAEADSKKEENLVDKRTALKEISLYFHEVQLGKREFHPEALKQLKKLLTVKDYSYYRDQYMEVIRSAFCFRTVEITHPAKTEAANFLNKVMAETKTVELGLILGFLTDGYISKSLAIVLEKQAQLIKDEGFGSFIFRFAEEIYNRQGTLEEDGTITPFKPSQKTRVERIYNLYKQ